MIVQAPPSPGIKKAVKELVAVGKALEAVIKLLPPWAQNIVDLLERSINKAHAFPDSGEFTPAMVGTLAGQIVASSELFLRKNSAEKTASPLIKKCLRELRKSFKDFRPILILFAGYLMEYSEGLSLADKSKFFAAKATAIGKNTISATFFETDATRVYVVLLCLLPSMNKIRSVGHLHEILCLIMGKTAVGDIDRVEGICRRIKLRFGKPGRPKKKAPQSP